MSLPQTETYTYEDYCTWGDETRWELIHGVPYAMAPAPSSGHQDVSGNLFYKIKGFLSGKPCKIFSAPFDVRLDATGADDTVCQPDLTIICDRSKIDMKGCKGVPDMVIEIVSPSTARHDRLIKYNLYRQFGVREYWIVDPESKNVSVNLLENGRYFGMVYGETDTAPVGVLPGCEIDLQDVFAE